MANEFIVKNGLVVSGSTTFLGETTGFLDSVSIKNTTQSLQNFSSSINSWTGSMHTWTGSIHTFTSSVTRDSASFDSRILFISKSYVAFTQSYFNDSASFNSRINFISGSYVAFTQSYYGDSSSFAGLTQFISKSYAAFTQSYYRDSASFDARINSIVGGSGVSNAVFEAYTASINNQTSSLLTWSSSIHNYTSSINTFTASILARKITRGAVYYNSSGLSDTDTGSVVVWRAPYTCTASAIYAWREGGTGAHINASKYSSLITASNLYVSSSSAWYSSSAVFQNNNFSPGDTLLIVLGKVTGSVTELSVQVDFTVPQ